MEQVKISASSILARLSAGESREEIRTSLGLKKAEFNRLMKNPALKNKKSKKAGKTDPFVFEDDVTTETPATETEAAPANTDNTANTTPVQEPVYEAPAATEGQATVQNGDLTQEQQYFNPGTSNQIV
jgi:hypothetical protein